MKRRPNSVCFLILLGLALRCTGTAHAVTIDMVTVGNPGNAPDKRYETPVGVGSVPYSYRIAKYEVAAGQYTEFLNAVAKDDPNGLYNEFMDVNLWPGFFGANITRSGSSPNFSYNVAPDWANRPVNYVSSWDAARFANWLHNGQPTGPQGPGTTEDGAYTNVGSVANPFVVASRQPGARFFTPTEDEWYKAAYHDKAAGVAASYFDYPTGTNLLPGNDITELTNPGNNANCDFDTIGSPYYRTIVGEFELSDSPYGTFDQGGNVLEWNEASMNLVSVGLRGGNWPSAPFFTGAGYKLLVEARFESSDSGFRMASPIPEPASTTIFMAGASALALRRVRKSR